MSQTQSTGGGERPVRRRELVRLAALVAAVSTGPLTACAGRDSLPRPPTTVSALPPPQLIGGPALTEALALRRSARAFTDRQLTRAEISQLLWAAQGITHGAGHRTAPSAGALFPLEVYVATRSTLMRYLPDGHEVEEWSPTSTWEALIDATPSTRPVLQAAAVFVIVAVTPRTAATYGGRAEQYVHLEAGHATQNLLLQAVSLGLGAVSIGAIEEDRVVRHFAMPYDNTPLYLVPVGHPAE
jgi:SagB-type dehydrogenase family enzyme